MQIVYIFLNVVSLIIISIVGVTSYKKRDEKYARYFWYSMNFMAIWTLGTIFELATHNYYAKVFFRNIVQVGMAFVSVTDYWFVITYTKSESKFHRIIFRLFIVLNSLAIVLLFTDPFHHLLRSKVELIHSNGAVDLLVSSTGLGIFFVQIRFLLFGFATVLLLIHLVKIFRSMQKQVIMIFCGYFISLLILFVKQYLFEEHGFSVPMSVIMCIPYIFIGIAVFRYDFLSIAPLAKDWVINSLEEGIIVLSKDGIVVESNKAGSVFLQKHGADIDEEALRVACDPVQDSVLQLEFESENGIEYYEIKIHHLILSSGKKGGGVAVVRNVTKQIIQQREWQEKAELDGLTQINNRKALERKYNAIEDGPISIIVIDIDKFKTVNDTYGHLTGDKVLIKVVEAMKNCVRDTDIIGRLGGDEFCIILEECSADRCQEIIARLFEAVKKQEYIKDENFPEIQISIGASTDIEVGKHSFEDVYKEADSMLYEAKQKGRNCAVIH